MSKILTISLVLLISMDCSSSFAASKTISRASEITPPTHFMAVASSQNVTPSSAPSANLHISKKFGFQFNYPSGYVIHSREEKSGGYIVITRQEDVNTSEPPVIFIRIRENPKNLSLKAFRNQEINPLMGTEHPNTTVAGQPALDYESFGLYEMRNLLFSTPDGRYVILFNVNYLEFPSETDILWQAAKSMVKSFRWIP